MSLPDDMTVHWIGAHPAEGSVSMDVYRRALYSVLSPDERNKISCWPERGPDFKKSKWKKFVGTYIEAPLRVHLPIVKAAKLVHFLDHSSGHLISHVAKHARVVVTLHDLIPLRDSGGLSGSQLRRFRSKVKQLIEADAIISVSEYSKLEAIELLGLEPAKIHVVANGVKMPEPNGDCKKKLPSSVRKLRENGADLIVLSIGSVLPRKNLELLPSFLESSQNESKGRKIGLLRVGEYMKPFLTEKIFQIVGTELFSELGRLEDSELVQIYRAVDVVIVPSFYEGFGLPILEAFAHGTPVACSETSSLPEVGGNCATYFNPTCPHSAAKAVLSAVDNDSEDLREKRIERACAHSWRKHVEGCFEVYQIVMSR